MKKTIRKIVEGTRNVPSIVFLILAGILNYAMGQAMLNINTLYSEVTEYEKVEFILNLVQFVAIWFILRLFNGTIGKIEKNKMLDENYLKWITRLTKSKLSSISKLTTGAAHNAISAIAGADKQMLNCIFGSIPSLYPFIILCIREYKVGGLLPPAINLICIAGYIIGNIFVAKASVYQKAAKAKASLYGVTVDCIANSKTVKYFGKESWSINRQDKAQLDSYVDFLALPAIHMTTALDLIMWIPTIANIYLCWGNMTDVLFIIMMGYSIDNIAAYVGMFMEGYSEKVSQLKVLGELEDDIDVREPIKDSIILKDIEFKYTEDSKVLFKIDELTIEKGHRYCITGKSGFGKSTLAKIITNTYPVQKGYVPNIDCVYMFAESELFNTTIYENIVLDEDADKEEIINLLKAFEVDVDIDIFSESVGEKGSKLSTGQIQRINLARTLFYARRHPGALIVMDEVTSALDEVTSYNCLRYLAEEFERLKVTLIYISNKPDYKQVNLITDNIYVHRDNNIVTYDTKNPNPRVAMFYKHRNDLVEDSVIISKSYADSLLPPVITGFEE
jgi:ABC-type bacteriocin/lantibiotic exporter with double-glycine peptidase domain